MCIHMHMYIALRCLSQIPEFAAGKQIDICGVILSCDKVETVKLKKTGENMTVRKVTIADNSRSSIELAIWGDDNNVYGLKAGSVILLKNVGINEFAGRTLKIHNGTK